MVSFYRMNLFAGHRFNAFTIMHHSEHVEIKKKKKNAYLQGFTAGHELRIANAQFGGGGETMVWGHFKRTMSCCLHHCRTHQNWKHLQMTAARLRGPSALPRSRLFPSAMVELVVDSRGFRCRSCLLSLSESLAN